MGSDAGVGRSDYAVENNGRRSTCTFLFVVCDAIYSRISTIAEVSTIHNNCFEQNFMACNFNLSMRLIITLIILSRELLLHLKYEKVVAVGINKHYTLPPIKFKKESLKCTKYYYHIMYVVHNI